VRHVLEIGVLHDRVASSVKISQPMLIHDNIQQWESVRLNLVPFTAADYKLATTQPTTQQVQEQFDRYKDVQTDSSNPTPGDPLGFGYKVPNRVKLQYIEVDRKAVNDAIRAGKSAYDWEVASRIYYDEHQDEFVRAVPATQPTTQPATQPTTVATTQPTMQPSATAPAVATTQPATTQPAVAQGPTTRPFAEVKDEILDKLTAPEADKLSAEVVSAIKQRLDPAWQTYERGSSGSASGSAAAPATQPAAMASTAPTTQPAGYDSYAFLETLALQIQGQYKLLPTVRQIGEWEDAQQLAKEPGIGTSHTPEFRAFPQYATEDAIAFNPTTQPSAGMLHLYQPSEMLTDAQKSSYLFRLTATSPAHPPQLQDIYARVEDDTRMKLAYGDVQNDAKKLLEQAQKDGLASAAVAAHRAVISTGTFRLDQRFIPNFMAGPRAIDALMGKARALLEEATPAHPHPVALVDMPSEKKVVVVELADVSMDSSDSQLFTAKLRALSQEQMRAEALAFKYFAYDAVAARLNYTAEKSEKDSGT
jgi:hypothetical protein